MAVIPDCPGVSAEILVDGRPLTEYTDEDDDEATSPSRVSRYIESVSGAKFSVRWSFAPSLYPNDSVSVRVRVDGKLADSAVQKHIHRLSPTVLDGARLVENGSWKLRAFQFADLVTTEDGAGVKPSPELKGLGTITLEFRRAQELSAHRPLYHGSQQEELKSVPEKHLKGQALSHHVKLGESKTISALEVISNRHLGNGPFAVFEFRYRSRKSLQSLYMIPRSPSPVPLEDRPEEELTREELLEFLRRQKRNKEERIKIKKELKRERNDGDDGHSGDDDDVVLVSSKRPRVGEIETIDLTDG